MKKFKNNIGVTGPESLVKAWAEEVLKLGYSKGTEFDKRLKTIECNSAVTYPRNIGGGEVTFYKSTYPACQFLYNLPQDWDKALAKAAEVEEEIPEYVEVTINYFGYKKGDICKVIEKEEDGDIIVYNPNRISYSRYTPNVCYVIKNTKPSTKEAYDKQQEEFKMKELLEEANKRHKKLIEAMYEPEEEFIEIAGYTAKFEDGKVSIGCYKDITLKDLKVLKKAIKLANKFSGFEVIEDSIIEGSENKMITLEEIEQLIERLDG